MYMYIYIQLYESEHERGMKHVLLRNMIPKDAMKRRDQHIYIYVYIYVYIYLYIHTYIYV